MPLKYQTPPHRGDNGNPSGSTVAAGKADEEEKMDWPGDGGPPAAQRLPCHPQLDAEEEEKEQAKQATAPHAGADRRQGEEERDNTKRSGGSNAPGTGGGTAAAAAVEPGGAGSDGVKMPRNQRPCAGVTLSRRRGFRRRRLR